MTDPSPSVARLSEPSAALVACPHVRWGVRGACRDCQPEQFAEAPNQVGRHADGTWKCILDHRTEPCGRCSGCREVEAEKQAATSEQGESRG